MSLTRQYEYWRGRLQKKYKAHAFLAYLQSFSNTHGPLSRLQKILAELHGLPELQGICLGTRPDCVDAAKLAAMAAFPGPENWLDMGLQSSNDETLRRINRGHSAQCFEDAVRLAHTLGIKVCAHVIAGLPGEGMKNFLATIDVVNQLPVRGIKIHNLYVCKGSGLARLWRKGQYRPLHQEVYTKWAVLALIHLRPDIIIHRINGDPQPGELLAPQWAGNKSRVLQAIQRELEEQNLWQGKNFRNETTQATVIPAWFERGGGLPDAINQETSPLS